MKEGELKICYKGEFNHVLEKVLGNVLKSFDYEIWASGLDMINNVRDLSFDKKRDNHELTPTSSAV